MSYVILFASLLALSIVSYMVEGWELLSPGTLVCISIILCCGLAMVGFGSWNTITIGPVVVLALLLGTACFATGSALSRSLYTVGNKTQSNRLSKMARKLTTKIPVYKILLLIIVIAIIGILHIEEMKKLATNLGITYDGIMDLSRQLRNYTNTVFSSSSNGFDAGFPLWDRFFSKIRNALGYISSGLLAYEIWQRKLNLKGTVFSIILFIECGVFSILEGGRSGTASYCVALILVYWLLCNSCNFEIQEKSKTVVSRHHSPASLSTRFFVGGAIIGVIALLLFYYAGTLFGRTANGDLVEYLSFYFGCSIPSFQKVLDAGINPYPIHGFNTFHEQMLFLSKFGLFHSLPGYGSYFVYLGGYASNVFTFVYRYYADFGMTGVAIFSSLAGICYGLFYRIARYSFRYSLAYGLVCSIVYAKIGADLVDACRDEKFFALVLNANNISVMVICIIIMMFLCYDHHNSCIKMYSIKKNVLS